MTWQRWLGALLVLFLWPRGLAAAVIWSDDFEGGDLAAAGWTQSGNWSVVTSPLSAHESTRGANIQGSTEPDPDWLLRNVSTVGWTDIRLDCWAKVREGLEVGDQVTVGWSADGLLWLPLQTYSEVAAGDWEFLSFALPAGAAENQELLVGFKAVLGNASDRMNFDSFVVSGTPVPEPAALLLFALGALACSVRRLS